MRGETELKHSGTGLPCGHPSRLPMGWGRDVGYAQPLLLCVLSLFCCGRAASAAPEFSHHSNDTLYSVAAMPEDQLLASSTCLPAMEHLSSDDPTSRLDRLLTAATRPLTAFAVDRRKEAVSQDEERHEIAVTVDEKGGARWRSHFPVDAGVFSTKIKAPDGDTSGLHLDFYLSSKEGEDSRHEIGFLFWGKDKGIVQTSYSCGSEETHELGFDSSVDFHEYTINWSPENSKIEWLVDGVAVRLVEKKGDEGFPVKPMYLFASASGASDVDEGKRAGIYTGSHAPYVIKYRDVRVPRNPHVQLREFLTIATNPLPRFAVDYGHEMVAHDEQEGEIALTFDHRGGARWRSHDQFESGTFSMKIKVPEGDTSGLNLNFYLSSLEGESTQDEIDFEFLLKDKGIVQTNYYTEGRGNREQVHQLGFDSAKDFHEYTIHWADSKIEWLIDGILVRTAEKKDDEPFPVKPMYLYASFWDASDIDGGRWCGSYTGTHAPYVGKYRDIRVPRVSSSQGPVSFVPP